MLNFLFEKTPFNYLFQSFWRDEAFSYLLAKKGVFEIFSLSAQDFTPPLYTLLLKFWMLLFGNSEIALRSLSLVAYFLTYYFFYNFLTKILKTDRTWTIIYSILFFVNPFLNYYAFEARAYSLFSLLTVASFYYFLQKKKVPYIVVTVLGLYTHYFMALVLIAQAAYLYSHRPLSEENREWLKNISKAFLFFAPWILFFIFKNRVATDAFWIDKPTFKTLRRLPSILYLGFESNFDFYKNQVGKLSLFLYSFVALGSWHVWKNRKNRDLLSILLIWAFLPALIIFIVSLVKPIFFPRYLILTASGMILLFVFLINNLKGYLKILLVALLIFFTLGYNNLQVKNRKKAPMREITREIKMQAGKNDLFYVTDILNFHTAEYYLGEEKVFVFNKSYSEIPPFVGRVLIPQSKIAYSLPIFPKRAFILDEDLKFDIQAAF